MEPQNIRFGGGVAGTVLHPLVAVAMLVAIALILFLPRKYASVPLLSGIFMIPLGQVVVLGGIHFTVLRILIIAGLVRLASSGAGSKFSGGFNSIDQVVMLWTLAEFAVFSLQWMQSQAMVESLGDLLDRLGGFLALRYMIQDREGLKRVVKVFAVLCLIQGLFMLYEQITVRNLFGLLGGISLVPQIREGQVRSQGVFGSYIDAGVFAGILIPLFIWLWSDRSFRGIAVVGIVGATMMALTCHASTALLAYVGGLLGLGFWRLRTKMRTIRRSLALTLTGLHLVMHAPVWSLIARVDLTGSSSSYHRYYLVDNCIRHFWDWWLLGTRVYDTWGWDMWDLSDQYVACAFTGGLAGLALFIAILSRCFGGIGRARKLVKGRKKEEWLLWCLGSAMFAMTVAYFGCSFMAQMQMELFAFLAIISVTISEARRTARPKAVAAQNSSLTLKVQPAAAVEVLVGQHKVSIDGADIS
jgi:hypothetical protein